jgi:hypothetical protein
MILENKKIVINNLKIKLEDLIKKSSIELPIDFNNILNVMNDHYQFINFTEYMKIYEDYKWNKIKEEYNQFKKKVNIDKKLYSQIIKIYGIINNYYSIDEFNIKNDIIKKLYIDTNSLKLEWEKIRLLHNLLINKRKNYVKNSSFIKIFITNIEIIELTDQLYKIYNNIKKLKN